MSLLLVVLSVTSFLGPVSRLRPDHPPRDIQSFCTVSLSRAKRNSLHRLPIFFFRSLFGDIGLINAGALPFFRSAIRPIFRVRVPPGRPLYFQVFRPNFSPFRAFFPGTQTRRSCSLDRSLTLSSFSSVSSTISPPRPYLDPFSPSLLAWLCVSAC